MKRWLAVIPLVVLAGFAVFAVMRLTSPPPEQGSFASPARPAPQLQLATLAGDSIAFGAPGQPVIVNFFASWCTPCEAEHPFLMDMRASGANLVGVLYKDQTEKGAALLARKGDPFVQVAVDTDGSAGIAFGIAGVPETFLIDAQGQIVKTMRGPFLDDATTNEFLEAYRALAATPAS
jgi:cytochrome c biogenesis protein CcmG/thiol:disulfide interchange protein DsbE